MSAATAFIGGTHLNCIDGRWLRATGGATLDVLDPATGERLASVPASEAEDADLAVALW
jgi:acyl-CoA reductase-like NAD-dependent aldehyde dehydrogenase